MNRRTILTAATWATPAVLAACTTPAYATSHTCSKRCEPTVWRRKVQHPSGATWWETNAETACPVTYLAGTSWIHREQPATQQVVWTHDGKTHIRVMEVRR